MNNKRINKTKALGNAISKLIGIATHIKDSERRARKLQQRSRSVPVEQESGVMLQVPQPRQRQDNPDTIEYWKDQAKRWKARATTFEEQHNASVLREASTRHSKLANFSLEEIQRELEKRSTEVKKRIHEQEKQHGAWNGVPEPPAWLEHQPSEETYIK